MTCLDTWLMATLAGAATMFVWGGISHMVLLKGIGCTRLSHEERIVSTLRPSLPGDGLYGFPRLDHRGNPTGEEQAAWEARFRAGPTGMIIYHAAGDAPVSPSSPCGFRLRGSDGAAVWFEALRAVCQGTLRHWRPRRRGCSRM